MHRPLFLAPVLYQLAGAHHAELSWDITVGHDWRSDPPSDTSEVPHR